MDAQEYKKLTNKFLYKKRKYRLPQDREIKWSYLWSLRKHVINGEPIDERKKYHFLKDHDYHDLIDFVEESLSLFHELDFIKILFSITDNSQSIDYEEIRVLKMHLEELLPRYEMEIQNNYKNLGIIFLDPISNKHNTKLREAYFQICQDCNMIDRYKHLKDSLNFEDSVHSVGIQIADFLAGCSASFVKSQNRDSYERGKQMFIDSVLPFLRRNNEGEILGYGIREVPADSQFRSQLIQYIS
jgi:hypothetical protein